jgi:hypothetical protein
MKRAYCFLLMSAQALAQPSPSPSPVPEVSAADIEKALREDTETQKKNQPKAELQNPQQQPKTGSGNGAWGRFIQSLNPDISAIIDVTPGYYSDENMRKSGDDPGATGFNIQELEVAFQATVDPYFRADIFLTVPNLQGVEVEEAYLTTTSLPGNLQIKAGIFRAQFGRQNTQHLHIQDFTRRPAINYTFLGPDGLRAPGAEINWLVPKIPFYLLFGLSAFSVDSAENDQALATFGGGHRYDLTYLGYAKAFFALNDSTSLYPGFSFAYGNTSQGQSQNLTAHSPACSTMFPLPGAQRTACDNFYDMLYGFDLYLKWKPPNQARSYASVAWQTEYFLRHIPELKIAGALKPQAEGGLYSQVVIQFARRWFVGIRGEVMGAPAGAFVRPEYAGALSFTCQFSEFARLRLYGEVREPEIKDAVTGQTHFETQGTAFLQLEASIGAHGAHPF